MKLLIQSVNRPAGISTVVIPDLVNIMLNPLDLLFRGRDIIKKINRPTNHGVDHPGNRGAF